jgi:hypothetical protein
MYRICLKFDPVASFRAQSINDGDLSNAAIFIFKGYPDIIIFLKKGIFLVCVYLDCWLIVSVDE